MGKSRQTLTAVARAFAATWRPLVATHLFYTLLAFAVLTPLVTGLLGLLVSTSGEAALSDQDILYFVLSPVGLLGLVLVAACVIAIVALEYAALMAIGLAFAHGLHIPFQRALVFALHNGLEVLQLAGRAFLVLLLVAAPFLAAAAGVYVLLLGDYDINFYLTDKPPEFWLAAGLIATLLVVMLLVTVRLLAGWAFALPMLLFEGVAPGQALRRSWEATRGQRRSLFLWVLAWLAFSLVLAMLAAALVGGFGSLVVPRAVASVRLLVLVLGLLMVLSGLLNVVVAGLNFASLSLLGVQLFRDAGYGSEVRAVDAYSGEMLGWLSALTSNKRTLLLGLAALVLLSAGVGYGAVRGVSLQDHAQIIAHRGASLYAPENSMAAVQRAIDDGADWVEIDVQETADGEVVVFHDSDFKKLAGNSLKIWDARIADLAEIDIGSSFAPEFADQRVPTLRQLLEASRGKIRVLIELKYYGHNQDLERRVVELVEQTGMVDQVAFMSLDYPAMVRMRALRPDWKLGLLTSVSVGDLARLDVDFLAVNAGFAGRGYIDRAHREGKKVLVWTVNDGMGMSLMMSRGVDGIITDDPGLARAVLAERAQLATPERLLVELAALFGQTPEYLEQ